MAKKIYILAGEPSGDFLGSRLMKQLKLRGNVEIVGVGGHLMEQEGLKSLFDIKEISIMGFFEILPKLPKLLSLIKRTIQNICNEQPDILVTIDSPGFNLKIAKEIKKLKKRPILVHYVAPSVWAYKPSRAQKFQKIFDYLLCLLPFEPDLFTRVGLKSYFVGHPIVEGDLATFQATEASQLSDVQIPNTPSCKDNVTNNILLLPGSRIKEVTKLLPIFLKVSARLNQTLLNQQFKVVVPTIPAMYHKVKDLCVGYEVTIVCTTEEKYSAMQGAKLALAASGTVTLELALAKVPTVVAYSLNFFTNILAAMLLKVKYVTLINILSGKEIFKECLGPRCNEDNIYEKALDTIRVDVSESRENEEAINVVLTSLGYKTFIPSQKAANIITGLLKLDV